MPKHYSQTRALWSITQASFRAIFSHPTAVVFSLVFPIVFILIFGAFGNGGPSASRIAIDKSSDTTGKFYTLLKNSKLIKIVDFPDTGSVSQELRKGRLAAVIKVTENKDSLGKSHYNINTKSTTASANSFGSLMQTLHYLKLEYESQELGRGNDLVNIETPVINAVRKYKQIDFILPGQLGFSILFSTLFGIAFTFFALREQLVLKRFYASPVKKTYILLGIGMSRLFFQLINIIVLIVFGHFFLGFTLVHGWLTVAEIIFMAIIMLFLLMGVGLIFSSIVKSDTTIPLYINLFGFPQMLLSGTFFPIEVFPKWLQQICNILPLTQFNNAIRKISFEGQHLHNTWKELGIMAIWIVVIYTVLARVIRWE